MLRSFKNVPMKIKITVWTLLGVAACVFFAWFLKDSNIAVLNPKGIIALKERDLIVIATLLMLIVVIPVFILMFVFAWKYREGNQKAKYAPDSAHNHLAEFTWWSVPFIIIGILSVITWKSTHDLDPYKPIGEKSMTIQVISLQWKWLFIYPEQGIATVNVVQFPEKVPIKFEITAESPMNSLWIPQLSGQIFGMTGMKTELNLSADEIGDYRGCSANISGVGFADMYFTAEVRSQADFDKWVESIKKEGKDLDMNEYLKLAVPSTKHPIQKFVLKEPALFDDVMMKYMMPM